MVAPALATGDLAVDHEVAQLSEGFRFLLDVTPLPDEAQRDAFLRGDLDEPAFAYRDLEADPDVLGAMLEAVDVGGVEDPTLGHLLRAKCRELELQIELLRARCTDDFLPLSVELYGAVAPALLRQAEDVLDRVPPDAGARRGVVDARGFVELAEAELDHYRSVDPDIGTHVEVRPDTSGVMVSGNVLLVGPDVQVRAERAMALVQHEVGVHLVTHVNGAHQPVRVLGTGLAGYEETQEGLAVLAEYLAGGLTPSRLRTLAARVVAVHEVLAGAGFGAVHRTLVDAGTSPSSAYATVVRCFRSGGLTKDAIYLRGLLDLLAHLRRGGDLDLLWLGKLSLEELPLVAELAERGVLCPPRLRPRFLDDPAAAGRLARAAATEDLVQLLEERP